MLAVSIRDRSRERSIELDDDQMPAIGCFNPRPLSRAIDVIQGLKFQTNKVSIRDRSRERSIVIQGLKFQTNKVSIRDRSRERSMSKSGMTGWLYESFNPRPLSRAIDDRRVAVPPRPTEFQSATALASDRCVLDGISSDGCKFQSATALASDRLSGSLSSSNWFECFNPRPLSRAIDTLNISCAVPMSKG